MKEMLVVLFAALCFYSSAQPGIAFTKTGDTIFFDELIPNKLSYDLYEKDSQKKQKVNFGIFSNVIYFPEYKIKSDKIDEFSGMRNIRTNIIQIASNASKENISKVNLILSIAKSIGDDSIMYAVMLRSPIELGCAGSIDNYVTFKFTDGDLLTLNEDIGYTDCTRNAECIYVLSENDVHIFKTHKLKAVRFKKSKFYEDYYTMFPNCISELLMLVDSQ